MDKKKSIIIIQSGDPRAALEYAAGHVPDKGRDTLILTRSSSRADIYARLARELNGGKISAGLTFMSLNSFIENYAALNIYPGRFYAGLEDKNLLIMCAAAMHRNNTAVNINFIDLLSRAISELKSCGVDISSLDKMRRLAGGAYDGLSFKCRALIEIYKTYQKLLEDKNLFDYYDKAAALSFDLSFSEYIRDAYRCVIFDRFDELTPIETAVAANIAVSAVQTVFIESSFYGVDFPAGDLYIRLRERIAAIGFTVETELFILNRDGSPSVSCRSHRGALKSSSCRNGFIQRIMCSNPAQEAEKIARLIASKISLDNIEPSSIAVFMPEFQSRRKLFKTAFDKYGLKFQTNEGIRCYDSGVCAKLKTVLKFIAAYDSDSFLALFSAGVFKRFIRYKNAGVNRHQVKKLLAVTKILGPGAAIEEQSAAAAVKLEFEENSGLMIELYGDIIKFVECKDNIFNHGVAGIELTSPVETSSVLPAGSGRFDMFDCFMRIAFFLKHESFVIETSDNGTEFFSFIMRRLKEYALRFNKLEIDLKFGMREGAAYLLERLSHTFAPDFIDNDKLKNIPSRDAVIIYSRENIDLFRCDYLFIAGAIEGVFPSSASGGSIFFEDSDRMALELYSGQSPLYRERFLFHQLLNLPSRGVFLSAPRAGLNSPFIESRFFREVENVQVSGDVEGVLCAADSVKTVLASAVSLTGGAFSGSTLAFENNDDYSLIEAREALRSFEVLRGRNTEIKNDFILDCSKVKRDYILRRILDTAGNFRMGATLVEKFYFCPARYFFSAALGIKAKEVYSGEIDPLYEGEIIHKTLELFFSDRPVLDALDNYFKLPSRRIELRADLERRLFNAGFTAMKYYCIRERFGDSYYGVKAFQYFNGLEGYLRGGSSIAGACGIAGYFKKFLSAHLDYIAAQNFYAAPAACEYQLNRYLSTRAGRAAISAKCDRIDAYFDNASGRLYFMIVDYKTGAVPAASDIVTLCKLQAPFYLYFLNEKLKEEIAKGTRVFKLFDARECAAVCFIYSSISKLDNKLEAEKFVFIPGRFLAARAGKKKDSGSDDDKFGEKNENEEFKLKFSCRANENYDGLIGNVPDIIENFIDKVSRGDFHVSILAGHDCKFCEFNRICHRNSRAAGFFRKKNGALNNGMVMNPSLYSINMEV